MIFNKVHGLYTTAFSARYQHVFSFLDSGHHFLEFSVKCTVCTNQRFQPESSTFCPFTIFSKVHECLPDTVFSLRSARFLIFALGAQPFSDFSKMHEFVQNSLFSPRSAHFVIFALCTPLFSDFQQSAQVCPKQRFSARDRNVLSFSHWAHHFLAIFSKVQEILQNSAFSPTSAPFVLLALGTPHFSNFEQSGRVCTKQRFQPKSSTFCLFHTGRTTF